MRDKGTVYRRNFYVGEYIYIGTVVFFYGKEWENVEVNLKQSWKLTIINKWKLVIFISSWSINRNSAAQDAIEAIFLREMEYFHEKWNTLREWNQKLMQRNSQREVFIYCNEMYDVKF